MDLCAEMLLEELRQRHADRVRADRVCPPFRRRAGRLPLVGRKPWAVKGDRFCNRFWAFPRYLRRRAADFDLFHVCDHSYAHLVHVLPPERTGVFCYDLDAFRCLLEPERERRSWWFRLLARRILRGLQNAAVVFHATRDVGEQLVGRGLVDPARLVLAPLGVSADFRPDADEDGQAREIVASLNGSPFLLHVGSCVPRKRVDVLLDVFAGARRCWPALKLVKVGGPWLPGQRTQIDRLGVESALVQVTGLERRTVAALYRRAALVLMPSEAEGFGLPVVEALASGGTVLASDLPVFREVGGPGVVYCPVGDVAVWTETVCRLLADPGTAPRRAVRLEWARRYSWTAHARTVLEAYESLRHGGGEVR
jgi:glycosyltransferase involved in cell wall biosynthesis